MMRIGSAPLISSSAKIFTDTSMMTTLDVEDSLGSIADAILHARAAMCRIAELAYGASHVADSAPEARLEARCALDDQLDLLLPLLEDRLEVVELAARALCSHFTETRLAEKAAGRP
jgi:hypothetical protein